MVVLVQQKKNLVLTLVKQIQNVGYVNKTEIYNFKAKDNISWYNFCLGSVSKDFTKDQQSEDSLNGTVYNFSVDHSSLKKEDILNIYQYLMIKNNIKQCLGL